jgi:hypothetical protein
MVPNPWIGACFSKRFNEVYAHRGPVWAICGLSADPVPAPADPLAVAGTAAGAAVGHPAWAPHPLHESSSKENRPALESAPVGKAGPQPPTEACESSITGVTKVRSTSLMTVVVAVGALSLSACSKPPEQAIQAGTAALEAAKAAGAETYAPEALQQAQDLLAQAEAAKKTQDEKFVLFRSYKDSEALYSQAKASLDASAQAAAAGKEQAKAEATQAIADANAAIAAAGEALSAAPRTKDSRADLELWANDLNTYGAAVAEADAALAAEDYLGAKSKAEGVTAKATEISTAIAAAMEKVGAKR